MVCLVHVANKLSFELPFGVTPANVLFCGLSLWLKLLSAGFLLTCGAGYLCFRFGGFVSLDCGFVGIRTILAFVLRDLCLIWIYVYLVAFL